MSRKKASRIYFFHSLLSRLYFFLPVLVLWFLAQGFTQFQATVLLAVFFLSVTLSEIPTGLLSDRFGYRQAMILCNLFQAAGVFILAYASSMTLATLGEILMGIGQAYYTGSKEAFLFNFLEEDNDAHHYQKNFAHSKIFEFIGMGLGSLVGGSVYVLSGRLPFFLTAAAFLAAAWTAGLLKEPSRKDQPPQLTQGRFSRGFRLLLAGPRELKILSIYFALFFATGMVFLVTLVQPYLKMSGLPLAAFGIVFLLFHGSSIGGNFLAKLISENRLRGSFFAALAASFGVGLAALGLIHHPLSFLLVAFLYIGWGLFLPTSSHAINQKISSHSRGSALAAQDFMQHFFFVILAPMLGLAADSWGLNGALLLLSGVSLGGAVFVFAYRTQR